MATGASTRAPRARPPDAVRGPQFPEIVYIDTYGLFATERRLLASLPDEERRGTGDADLRRRPLQRRRRQVLADKLWSRLDKRWQITAQADRRRPIDTRSPKAATTTCPASSLTGPTVASSGSSDTTSLRRRTARRPSDLRRRHRHRTRSRRRPARRHDDHQAGAHHHQAAHRSKIPDALTAGSRAPALGLRCARSVTLPP